MKRNDGGPAYPINPPCDQHGALPRDYPFPDPGMSLRDWFAGQALVGIGVWCPIGDEETKVRRAKWAYAQADAMIAERDK